MTTGSTEAQEDHITATPHLPPAATVCRRLSSNRFSVSAVRASSSHSVSLINSTAGRPIATAPAALKTTIPAARTGALASSTKLLSGWNDDARDRPETTG